MRGKNLRRDLLRKSRRVVVKVGSSVLVERGIGLNLVAFSRLAKEISHLHSDSRKIVLVTSGAIAAGMERLEYEKRPDSLPHIQAAAAIGQPHLMKIYQDCFSNYRKKVAQILLTHEDLSDRHRYLNARNTLLTLLELGIIPIINENDTVVVEEIKFGDNDNLSALITNLIEADLLVILTNIGGICDADPRYHPQAKCIPLVENIDMDMEGFVGDTDGEWNVGGMISKIQAAKKASHFGIPTVIACGTRKDVLHHVLKGKEVGTLILPKAEALSSRKHWIAFNLKPQGDVVVDEGAKKAIVQKGKSLLASGVVKVKGNFDRGDLVSCLGPRGKEFARGLVNYSAPELEKIKGLHSQKIDLALGYRYSDEVIHRDDLVVL